jgi:hypothetical protein
MAIKIIRVPWIRCRADEVDALPFELEWRGRVFSVLAYTENEARDWWRSLPEAERERQLGGGGGSASDGEMQLF